MAVGITTVSSVWRKVSRVHSSLSSQLAVVQRRLFSREALRSALSRDNAPLAGLALLDFLAHMLVAGNYGYFRDELYYIIAGTHFQTGYVDFPPFIAWLAAVLRIFGDNLVVLHAVSAFASACIIVVTGLMARELGGNRFAQGLAALGSLVALTFLATGSLFTMDVFDELWWALAAYIFIRLVKRNEPRLWLLFGLVAGVGLFTKLTMLFFGFGLVVGLLLTSQRQYFRSRWIYLGGLIAFAFLVPYIAWQIPNGWPTLAFWRNYGGVGTGSSPIDFLLSQVFTINPATIPLWIGGLIFYFGPRGKPYRALGWAFVVLYALFTLTQAKSYFLAPAYPMLFAAGAVPSARAAERKSWSYVAVLFATGLAFAPSVMPVLPPAQYGQLYGWIGPLTGAKQQEGSTPLLQILADRFGWPEQAAAVAKVYDALPADQKAQACIATANYGEASAINFFGPQYHLPPAISGHNTYYIWGPGNCSGHVVITIGMSQADLQQSFAQVTPAATITCANCVDEESHLTIYVCQQPKYPIQEIWQRTKHFD